jgi:small GTP-binding protein
MEESLVYGIVYTLVDEEIGPSPAAWDPTSIEDNILTHVSIKVITLLTAEQGLIPSSPVIIPFPSLGLKGIIKYVQFKDTQRRGNMGQAAITLLFNEVDDIIFYKAIEYFEISFNEIAHKIIELEESKASKEQIKNELKNLHSKVLGTLNELRIKETEMHSLKAFPEEKIFGIDKIKFQFKIIVCGDPTVGKTSIILRFTENAFNRKYIPSIGINVSDKIIKLQEVNVQLVLWDIAGQSKFTPMRSAFYNGAKGMLLVFDITNPKSFEDLKLWYKDINKHISEDEKLVGFLIGNKCDIPEKRKISFEEAKNLAQKFKLDYMETSAMTGDNIKDAFQKIANTLYLSNR